MSSVLFDLRFSPIAAFAPTSFSAIRICPFVVAITAKDLEREPKVYNSHSVHVQTGGRRPGPSSGGRLQIAMHPIPWHARPAGLEVPCLRSPSPPQSSKAVRASWKRRCSSRGQQSFQTLLLGAKPYGRVDADKTTTPVYLGKRGKRRIGLKRFSHAAGRQSLQVDWVS